MEKRKKGVEKHKVNKGLKIGFLNYGKNDLDFKFSEYNNARHLKEVGRKKKKTERCGRRKKEKLCLLL